MQLNKEFAELIGIIIGDGFVHRHDNSYRIGIVGNPKTDMDYFYKIQKLIWTVWQKEARIVKRERGLRMTFGSKRAFEDWSIGLKLSYGEGKCERITIPRIIADNWNLAKHTIRGIVDTDGSVFTANKLGTPNYPSIEITTSSYLLALQLKEILEKQDFRVAKIWQYKSKLSSRTTYKVPLNGYDNLAKWLEEIGFSNPNKLNRAISASKIKK